MSGFSPPARFGRVSWLNAGMIGVLVGLQACGPPGDEAPLDIFQAVRAGDLPRVGRILDEDPSSLEATDPDGFTPLHHAAEAGALEMAAELLDRGAGLEVPDVRGHTPLHRAANAGNAGVVALLLEQDADITARDLRGRIPLFLAVNWGDDLETVRRLVEAGSDVNDRTPFGEQMLFSTLYFGRPEIIDLLLDSGARLPDSSGSIVQAMNLAGGNGFERVFRMAQEEAEERGVPWWEEVPMTTAALGGSVAIASSLFEKGVSVTDVDRYGVSPLYVAAEAGHADLVEWLVENGAELDTPSAMGLTAYNIAAVNGHGTVAARLLELGASSAPAVFPEHTGSWLGQVEPEAGPERFAPGIVSRHGMNAEHSPAAFSPDGTEVLWTKAFRGPILHSRLENGRWTMPEEAPFNTEFGEGEPIYSPDGGRLYFLSMRPLGPGSEPGKENIWFVARAGQGWSEPRPLDPVVNEFNHHWLFSLTESGTLYFSAAREGGYGGRDIYRSRRVDGTHQRPELLGQEINTEGLEHTPFIAPDESYLIFVSDSHEAEGGTFALHISFRGEDDRWTPARSLAHITAPVQDPLCPLVTPDGRFLFFIGSGDVWWTPADFIEEMRPGA